MYIYACMLNFCKIQCSLSCYVIGCNQYSQVEWDFSFFLKFVFTVKIDFGHKIQHKCILLCHYVWAHLWKATFRTESELKLFFSEMNDGRLRTGHTEFRYETYENKLIDERER